MAVRRGFVPGALLNKVLALAILGKLKHKQAIAGTERLDGSDAAFGHKAEACHLRG
jgi:hypothetical protein